MTAPAHSPRESESSQAAAPVDRRSRKVYILWGIALTLLLSAALFCWLVVVPVWQVRNVIRSYRHRISTLSGKTLPNTLALNSQGNQEATESVTQLGGPPAAIGKLRLYIKCPASLAPHRPTAVSMLGYCGKTAVPELLILLNHEDKEVRYEAAGALGVIAAPEAVEPLCGALKDENDMVRMSAAQALGEFKSPIAEGALIGALEKEDSQETQMTIACSLGNFKTGRSVRTLIAASRDEVDMVRRCAVGSLQEIGPPAKEAVPHLIDMLVSDPDNQLRDDAVHALCVITGNPRLIRRWVNPRALWHSVDLLKQLTKDPDPNIREAAARALPKADAARKKLFENAFRAQYGNRPPNLGGEPANDGKSEEGAKKLEKR
jgi:HEAT repeat protein